MKATNRTLMTFIEIGGGTTKTGSMRWSIEDVIEFLTQLKCIWYQNTNQDTTEQLCTLDSKVLTLIQDNLKL
jgi:hypothetical protein